MAKMWEGRLGGNTDKIADDFNSSIEIDSRMFKEDIAGSIAHAQMLAFCNIISKDEAKTIIDGLSGILADLTSGAIKIDTSCEDIHMFIEQELTNRIGDCGKKLHTARSRNDQVALDLRLYLKNEIAEIIQKTKNLIAAITQKAKTGKDYIMPGYTHLQRAQPVTFGHQLMAYAFMLLRDIDRLGDCAKRTDISPIGSCALAGTTFNTDRFFEAQTLGLSGVCENSLDGVSDRDFALELLADLSILMMHLSRFAEEIVLWQSFEFRFIELSDAFTTGSSIMPQKKNPDMAELVRGKTGRVYGDLMALLTTLKGLPLAYNKDMQEDKEAVFDACDTVKACLEVFCGIISTLTPLPQNMKKAAQNGFINATDLADYLVQKGLPFRTAYKISGQIVSFCIQNGKVLQTLPLKDYQTFCELIDEEVYTAVDLSTCLNNRKSYGGTSVQSVEEQIKIVQEKIK